ncbi:hypothetical protein M0R45_006772 [Rubus argutus]|uniref:Uncharacterized protein n=1 Tax=Rubus argutus TaxID=59490 RepID=A0AAW1YRI9_RUBAR
MEPSHRESSAAHPRAAPIQTKLSFHLHHHRVISDAPSPRRKSQAAALTASPQGPDLICRAPSISCPARLLCSPRGWTAGEKKWRKE